MTDPAGYATPTDTGRLRALTSAAVVVVEDRRRATADPDRLQQIPSDLLSNAVRSTRGPIRVLVPAVEDGAGEES